MCSRGACVAGGCMAEGVCVRGREGYVWQGACMAGGGGWVHAGETATEAGGTHLIGMHSCLQLVLRTNITRNSICKGSL